MTENRWQRLGGVCGVLYVAVVVAGFFAPTTPDADEPTAEIGRAIAEDRTGLIAGAYLNGLAVVLFLPFVAALAGFLRSSRAAVLASGTAVAVGSLMSVAVSLALVQSAHEQREPAAVRALFELDELVLLPFAFAVAAFLAAAAIAMPARPLGRVAAVLAALVLVGLLGLFSADEEEGGVLGIALTVGLLAHYLWILAAGVVLARPAVSRSYPVGLKESRVPS